MLDDVVRWTFAEGASAGDVRVLAAAPGAAVEIVFELDELPPDMIAALVDAVDQWLDSGRRVTLNAAPQMLAHTLYKVGRLNRSSLLSISVRETEPYAG